MNYQGFYPNYMQNYQTPQTMQTVQQPQSQVQQSAFISVKNIDEAYNWPVGPGNSLTFKDENFNQLVALNRVENPEVIPSFWYGHTRQEVDQNTKKESIKSGANGWVNWEKDTKKLYEKLYSELININEIAAAEKVKELIIDVDYELKEADDFLLKLIAVNYDMSVIIPEQEKENKKYMRKLEDFKIC